MTVTAAINPDTTKQPRGLFGNALFQQKLIYTGALAVALACIAFSVPMTLAGIASGHTERALQQWDQSEAPPSEAYWETTLIRAERAAKLYPVSSGQYLDRLGRVHAWGSLAKPEGETETYMRASLAAFDHSLASRTTWPWTWLRIAYTKRALGELDEDFGLAMAAAARFGQGRVEVSDGLARLGFMSWADLDREQRALTLAAAGRAVAHSPAQAEGIYDAAVAHGLETPLCWTLSTAVKSQQRICKEAGSL